MFEHKLYAQKAFTHLVITISFLGPSLYIFSKIAVKNTATVEKLEQKIIK